MFEQSYAAVGLVDHQAAVTTAATAVHTLSEEQLQTVFATSVPLPEPQRLLVEARNEIDQLQAITDLQAQAADLKALAIIPPCTTTAPQIRAIDIPSIDVTPSVCAETTGAATFIALALSRTYLKIDR